AGPPTRGLTANRSQALRRGEGQFASQTGQRDVDRDARDYGARRRYEGRVVVVARARPVSRVGNGALGEDAFEIFDRRGVDDSQGAGSSGGAVDDDRLVAGHRAAAGRNDDLHRVAVVVDGQIGEADIRQAAIERRDV